jgi:hypothetical protein
MANVTTGCGQRAIASSNAGRIRGSGALKAAKPSVSQDTPSSTGDMTGPTFGSGA